MSYRQFTLLSFFFILTCGYGQERPDEACETWENSLIDMKSQQTPQQPNVTSAEECRDSCHEDPDCQSFSMLKEGPFDFDGIFYCNHYYHKFERSDASENLLATSGACNKPSTTAPRTTTTTTTTERKTTKTTTTTTTPKCTCGAQIHTITTTKEYPTSVEILNLNTCVNDSLINESGKKEYVFKCMSQFGSLLEKYGREKFIEWVLKELFEQYGSGIDKSVRKELLGVSVHNPDCDLIYKAAEYYSTDFKQQSEDSSECTDAKSVIDLFCKN